MRGMPSPCSKLKFCLDQTALLPVREKGCFLLLRPPVKSARRRRHVSASVRIVFKHSVEEKGGDNPMATEGASPVSAPVRRVTRHFDGSKDPEALLRALIQAHKPHVT